MSLFGYWTTAAPVVEPRSLDQWAAEWAGWTVGAKEASLAAFVAAASAEMPFSVWQQLSPENRRQMGESYAAAIRSRRLQAQSSK